MNDIKNFFDECAQKYGADPEATCPDRYFREVEIRSVAKYLRGERILDVGCGNGYGTIRYRMLHPANYFGLDYSNDMLEVARKAAPDVEWIHGDVLDPHSIDLKFDTIVSARCIINLQSWAQQEHALENMLYWLKPQGRLIILENFLDGLKALNVLRLQFGLDPIEVRWHNRYLLFEEVSKWLEPQIGRRLHVEHHSNIGGLYYLLSRVVYATLCKQQGIEPVYGNTINEIASRMPHVEMPYSANYLIVLDKIS